MSALDTRRTPGGLHISGLVVFDIDGTLTDTNAVDDECYLRSVAAELGLGDESIDWADAPHMTDTGIARWLWTKHRRAEPSPTELEQFRDRLVRMLATERRERPHRFQPVPGAIAVFAALETHGWSVAMATGAWASSARLKLEAAGITADGIVFASGDDGVSREEIVRCACRRATERHGRPFTRVVSVGDGPWDVRTAASLGLPFIGIGSGAGADRLRAAGAGLVLDDLSDMRVLLAALAAATVPGLESERTAL